MMITNRDKVRVIIQTMYDLDELPDESVPKWKERVDLFLNAGDKLIDIHYNNALEDKNEH